MGMQDKIPKDTPYCYTYIKNEIEVCPFWDNLEMTKEIADKILTDRLKKHGSDTFCWYNLDANKNSYEELLEKYLYDNKNYYSCSHLDLIDDYQGETLLWDMCKECGINVDYEDKTELGQLMFSSNGIQQFVCPDWVIALLKDLSNELEMVMWNVNQEEYDSPFQNTGNEFIGKCFEVHAYDWNENEEQEFNFKYGDIKISWYKYLGRGTTINGLYHPEKIIKMHKEIKQEIWNIKVEDFK